MLRSPTAAWILSNEPFNLNTRSCGTEDYALIPLDAGLIGWADQIIVMDEWQARQVNAIQIEMNRQSIIIGDDVFQQRPVLIANVSDPYDFKHPQLIGIMTELFNQWIDEGKL